MEAVSSDLVVSVILERQSIHISLLGHCLMESRIENSYHGRAGHKAHAGVYADQVCRVVKRSQVGYFLDRLDNLVCDNDRGCELLAAVDDSVTYSADLAKRFQNACLLVGQCAQYKADCLIVIGHRDLIEFLSGIVCLILISDAGTVHADSLAKALGQELLGLCIDDLELK